MTKWLNIVELESLRSNWVKRPHVNSLDNIYSHLNTDIDERGLRLLTTTGEYVNIIAKRKNGAWLFTEVE